LPADASVRVRYKRAALVKVLIVDTDFVLVFADGRKILIKDGALRATLDNDYTIGFSDEEVPARSLFAQAETAEASTDAVPLGSMSEGMSSPRLEPSESDVALAPAATTLTVKAAASGLGSLGAVGGVVAAVTCPPTSRTNIKFVKSVDDPDPNSLPFESRIFRLLISRCSGPRPAASSELQRRHPV
jgi:hypothetical protein